MDCPTCTQCQQATAPLRTGLDFVCQKAVPDPELGRIELEQEVSDFQIMLYGQSAVQSVRIKVENWQKKVIVQAPTGFGVSFKAAGPYTSKAVLAKIPEAKTLNFTRLFVRFIPVEQRDYTGVLTIRTLGAISRTVPVQGILI